MISFMDNLRYWERKRSGLSAVQKQVTKVTIVLSLPMKAEIDAAFYKQYFMNLARCQRMEDNFAQSCWQTNRCLNVLELSYVTR